MRNEFGDIRDFVRRPVRDKIDTIRPRARIPENINNAHFALTRRS